MRNVVIFISLLGTIANAEVGKFVPTGSMVRERSGHRATLLADGKVLITGGAADKSAELYDPLTHAFTLTGLMNAARANHSATVLADGKVLIAGGDVAGTAEIYDPASMTFTATGPMLEVQFNQAAALLPDGRVVLVGGESPKPPYPTVAPPELYDPASGTFSLAAPPAGAPLWPTANALPDGKVLFVGGNPPDVYDPNTGTFSLTGPMVENGYRYGVEWHASTTLKDGSVLITGGNDDWTCGGFRTAEIYEPSIGKFRILPPMIESRDIHTSTLLMDGTVLITGGGEGWCFSSTHDSAEIYDPATERFTDVGKMSRPRIMHTATLLTDGTVLITGGAAYWPATVTSDADLYVPAALPARGRRSRR